MYLRSQTELLADVRNTMRDNAVARWNTPEVYRAINRALQDWSSRVKAPMVYTLDDGWDSTTYDYELPAYMRPPIRPQVRFDTQPDYGGGNTWTDLREYGLEPNATGTVTLRLRMFPYDPTLTHEGRILWEAPNSPLPVVPTTLESSISSSATSLTLDAALDIADTGWVKIDNEWIAYAGVTRNTATTVLLNLRRGEEDTTTATHNAFVSVYHGVCVPNMAMLQQLLFQTLAYLHEMFLTDASPQERDMHERMMMYYDGKVAQGWRRFTPRAPRMVAELEHI